EGLRLLPAHRRRGDLRLPRRLLHPARRRPEPRRREGVAGHDQLPGRPARLLARQGLDPRPHRRGHRGVPRLPADGHHLLRGGRARQVRRRRERRRRIPGAARRHRREARLGLSRAPRRERAPPGPAPVVGRRHAVVTEPRHVREQGAPVKAFTARYGAPLLMILPSLILIGVFVYGRLGVNFGTSMTDTHTAAQASGREPSAFVGLRNYIDLLLTEDFRHSLANLVLFTATFLIGALAMGFVWAWLLERP